MAANIILTLNRGDSFDYPFFIDDPSTEDHRYIMTDQDTLYFGLMDPRQPFEYALIKKRYTKQDFDDKHQVIIHFDPDDTIDLLPGNYYYMIKLKTELEGGHTIVQTIVNKRKFVIFD